jgi:hypothetical protein
MSLFGAAAHAVPLSLLFEVPSPAVPPGFVVSGA